MVFGLLFSFLPFLLLFVLIRAVTGKGKGAVGGHPVRHFFQYSLLYGLTVVSAIGLSGLLQRALPHGQNLYGNKSDLAASLAFTIVGLPLLALIANWTRRRFVAEPAEKRSFGWGIYLTFAGITSLVVALQASQSSLQWVFGADNEISSDLAMAIVWILVWVIHWRLDRVVTPDAPSTLHHVIGSIIGLAWGATGLGMLLTVTFEALLPPRADALVDTAGTPFANAAITFVVGAIAWYFYWVRTYARARRDGIWDAYLMVVGIAGGLVTAVVSASVFLYQLLVWFLGSTDAVDAAQHFRNSPAAVAAMLVGVLVWWYHRAVLAETARTGRSEGQRIYEYLIGAIGLIAAAVGLMVMLAALIESVTPGNTIAGSDRPRNTLLLATTLLVVGAPVWWIFWRRVELAVHHDRGNEVASPARRFYLFMLFGIGGTAAVISILVAVYQLFDDVVSGNAGSETLRSMRWALGVLVATGAVAGYHWLVYRGERDVVGPRDVGPKYVLLAGVPDRALASGVADVTSGHVDAWLGVEVANPGVWTVEAVQAALAGVVADEIVVVAEAGSLRAIAVDRR